ncbi:MAG: polyprenyl synthetase family protein [Alphaproteobacteria bacterium]|nr:MAG: polyprenyl synthetase family protein [Alphaproteobacteria bacterium]
MPSSFAASSFRNDRMPDALARLASHLSVEMATVDRLILEHVSGKVPLIGQVARHLIAAGGKRIRPLLTLASASLFDDRSGRAHALAACVEFIHTATLLHDDVVDDSHQRRGKPSANAAFGNPASILVGDFLFSRAFQLMVADGSLEVLRLLSDTSATIAQGEVHQLAVMHDLAADEESYLQVISAKTAALFAAACEIGAVIATRSEAERAALRAYGMALGIAFQIMDDVLDYDSGNTTLGKESGRDFREGKLTLPTIYALRSAGTDEQAFWRRTMGDLSQQEGDLEQACRLIESCGATEQARQKANDYAAAAQKALEGLPASPLRDLLGEVAAYTVTRQH